MMELHVDPEFQNKIPPLTEAEYKQLEENILSAGEIYEPIIVWNGIIVDGHNRYKIACEHPEVIWRTREMTFADKWEAFDLMYKNQFGRRNLTDEQRAYLLGKQYEARKHVRAGAFQGNSNASKTNGRKTANRFNRDGTSKIIADEHGVGKTKVKDSYKFAKGIDRIRECDPELAEKILTGDVKAPRREVADVCSVDEQDLPEAINSIRTGKKASICRNGGNTKEHREEIEQISSHVANLYSTDPVEYDADSLITDIRNNSSSCIKLLNHIISEHKKLCFESKHKVIDAINISLVHEINKIKEMILNEQWT